MVRSVLNNLFSSIFFYKYFTIIHIREDNDSFGFTALEYVNFRNITS